LAAGLIFALFVILRSQGILRSYLLWYFSPVGVVFAAFILDRIKVLGQTSVVQLVLDLGVTLLSLARALTFIPLISGHALFLSYTLLSTRLRVVQLLAAVVLLEVVYLKLYLWDDPVTLLGGTLVGGLAAFCYRRWIKL
jgi:hypothetical protein